MQSESSVTVESHHSFATLYATGELTTAAVLRVIAGAEDLPRNVRAVCIDLRAVQITESHAVRALEIGLRDWRAARCGMSRVKLPADAETSVVALKYTHLRWAPRRD